MNKYFLMWVKFPFYDQDSGHRFRKGDVYFITAGTMNTFKEAFVRLGKPNGAEFFSIFEFFKTYDASEKGNHTALVIRSGGIGDILALSTICDQIPGRVIFWTQGKNFPIFNYYEKQVVAKDFHEAVFTDVSFAKLMHIKKTYRLVNFEERIENGSSENWFDIFYSTTGMKADPDRRRPELVDIHETKRLNHLLICHRSTASMRSMAFKDVFNAVMATKSLQQFRPICVHDIALNEADRKFVRGIPQELLTIVHANGIKEFLTDVYLSGMVVSVDTAAIHFREGLALPGIGIYNSFTAYCRTDGYQFTHSFDIESKCDIQPCFLHEFRNGKVQHYCDKDYKQNGVAPCFSRQFTPDLHRQLVEGFTDAMKRFETIQYAIEAALIR